MLNTIGIDRLYYFAPIKNLSNILNYGILSKNEINNRRIPYDSFANEEVQNKRHSRYFFLSNTVISSGHDCVPLYMRPLSPTQYACKEKELDFIFFVFDSSIVNNSAYAFSDGNIACKDTRIFNSRNDLGKIPVKAIGERYWTQSIDGKRKASSEVLIHKRVSVEEAKFIVVSSNRVKKIVEDQLSKKKISIEIKINENYYFTRNSLILH